MDSEVERVEALEYRCSRFAMELLRELINHFSYPRIVRRLSEIDGPISRANVEREYLELRKNYECSKTPKADV